MMAWAANCIGGSMPQLGKSSGGFNDVGGFKAHGAINRLRMVAQGETACEQVFNSIVFLYGECDVDLHLSEFRLLMIQRPKRPSM